MYDREIVAVFYNNKGFIGPDGKQKAECIEY